MKVLLQTILNSLAIAISPIVTTRIPKNKYTICFNSYMSAQKLKLDLFNDNN